MTCFTATLRNKPSKEKVKTWWAEVEGPDACDNKFLVPEALQKCSPTSLLKEKFTEQRWKIKFDEHEDQDLFVQVLNRGVSFHGQRPRVTNWVFLYTLKELWEEVERLAGATNKIYHEGLGDGKSSSQNAKVVRIGGPTR